MFVVVEIDGVIADSSARSKFLEGEQADWDAYLNPTEVAADKLIPAAKKSLDTLLQRGWTPVVITDRPESLRDATMRWLTETFDMPLQDAYLMMRPAGNMLTNPESKKGHLQEFVSQLEQRKAAFIFIDKDKDVLKLYAAYGVPLLAPECWDSLYV